MTTTIQTIKEAEERIKSNFKRDNTGEKVEGYLLYPSVTYNTEQYVKIATQNDVMQEVRQTLLAVFESELESVPENEEFTYPDPTHMLIAGNAKGDNEEIRWAKHCVDKNASRNIERAIINQERARQRSHLTEVINYLKQK